MNRYGACGTPDQVNSYFASIATDNNYSRDAVIDELNRQTTDSRATQCHTASYSPTEIAIILSKVTKTATGPDGIPYWIIKECALELSYIVSRLVNFSLNRGVNCAIGLEAGSNQPSA